MTPVADIAFDDLLQELKRAGFAITMQDPIEFAAIFSRYTGERADLKYWLAPIVCRNREEQERFYAVYDHFVEEAVSRPNGGLAGKADGATDGKPDDPARKRSWFAAGSPLRNVFFWYFMLFVLAALVRVLILMSAPHHHQYVIPEGTVTDTVVETPVAREPVGRHRPVLVAKPFAPSKDSGELRSLIVATGKPIEKENSIDSSFFGRMLVLGMALLGLSVSFFPQMKSKLVPRVGLDQLEGDDTPIEIPFHPQDRLIRPMPVLSRVAKSLRQRVATGHYRLDIHETILHSVRSYGMLSPVYAAVERRPEYLVLIDRTQGIYPDLFRWLAELFIDELVSVNYYFFDDLRTIDFYGLLERHSHARLLIMGDVNNELPVEFLNWEERAIITPVPVSEWGADETALARRYKLLSADVGQLARLADLFTDDEVFIPRGREGGERRSMRGVEEVRQWMDNEDLFQWVCAAALYPTIEWEVLIAVGAAVLQDRKAAHQLTYTNLLRIARTGWFDAKTIPPAIRIELLKKLELSVEIVARTALLALLKSSEDVLAVDSVAYGEMMRQVYTQRFVLYSHEPRKHSGFEAEARKFMSLWQKRALPDLVTVLYLQNPDAGWDTPVRSPEHPSRPASADRFMQELLALRIINNPRIRAVSRNAAMICFFLLFLLILFKDAVQPMSINKKLSMVQRDYGSNPVSVVIPVNDCLRGMVAGKWLLVTLNNYDNNRYSQLLPMAGKDSLVVNFGDITMAGKDPGKPCFQIILNNELTINCLTTEFFSRYVLRVQGVDCDSRLRIVEPVRRPNLPHSDQQ